MLVCLPFAHSIGAVFQAVKRHCPKTKSRNVVAKFIWQTQKNINRPPNKFGDYNMLNKTLNISTSPHITKGTSTEVIMRNVVWALLPVAAFAVYSFGLSALLVLATTTAACVLTEHFLCKYSKRESTVSDWSAVITGLLLGLTLPPSFPLWMAFAGGVVAIALGKFIFGGLGYNVFNPALVGRAVLQAAFPVAIYNLVSVLFTRAFFDRFCCHIHVSIYGTNDGWIHRGDAAGRF